MQDAPCSSETEKIARQLLDPLSPRAFLNEVYGRHAVRLPDAGGQRVTQRFENFLDLEGLESQMRAPGFFETVSVAMRTPGSPDSEFVADMASVHERLSKGDALQVIGLERVLPDRHPLIRTFRALEELCQAPARAITVFVAPPGAALPRHDDPYEVFSLQISGRKSWHLFDAAGPTAAAGDDAVLAPAEVFDLGPGDLLYMPKQLVHRADPGEGVSLSVALVYDPPSWLAVIDALSAAVEGDRRFWQALPPDGIEAGFEARRALLREALEALDAEAFAERMSAERRAAIPGLPASHLASCFGIDAIDSATTMRLRPGPAPIVIEAAGLAILVSAFDQPISAPLSAITAFRFISERRKPFRVAEICDTLSDGSKVALVCKLARRGILQFA